MAAIRGATKRVPVRAKFAIRALKVSYFERLEVL
jgi:hypothetical protein